VAELRDVLTALELTATPVILVGHSLGTAVSQCYAALYAAHVRGLVLLDPIDRVSDLPQLDAAQALQVAAALVPTHRCVDSIAEQPIVTATSAGPDVSPPPSPLLDATAIVAAPAAASLHSAWLPGVEDCGAGVGSGVAMSTGGKCACSGVDDEESRLADTGALVSIGPAHVLGSGASGPSTAPAAPCAAVDGDAALAAVAGTLGARVDAVVARARTWCLDAQWFVSPRHLLATRGLAGDEGVDATARQLQCFGRCGASQKTLRRLRQLVLSERHRLHHLRTERYESSALQHFQRDMERLHARLPRCGGASLPLVVISSTVPELPPTSLCQRCRALLDSCDGSDGAASGGSGSAAGCGDGGDGGDGFGAGAVEGGAGRHEPVCEACTASASPEPPSSPPAADATASCALSRWTCPAAALRGKAEEVTRHRRLCVAARCSTHIIVPGADSLSLLLRADAVNSVSAAIRGLVVQATSRPRASTRRVV
jgi:pimeloyl-ACP methyl ester carboxylesterase